MPETFSKSKGAEQALSRAQAAVTEFYSRSYIQCSLQYRALLWPVGSCMVSTAQTGQSGPPAQRALPLRTRHQSLDGLPLPTASSTSPPQLHPISGPGTSRALLETLAEQDLFTRKGFAPKGEQID